MQGIVLIIKFLERNGGVVGSVTKVNKPHRANLWNKHYETALKSPAVWQYWLSWSKKFVSG